MEYKKESFKAIVRKSNKKYLKEGSERMEKFLFKKILINKVTALKNL